MKKKKKSVNIIILIWVKRKNKMKVEQLTWLKLFWVISRELHESIFENKSC